MRAWLGMAVFIFWGGSVMSNDEVVLVAQGQPRATILAPAEGPPKYAAEQLQHYLREMTGAELPIAEQAPPPRIVMRVVPKVVRHDGFWLRVQSGDVFIEAAMPRSCIYGAYALLEELGCRFYGPAPLGVIIPKKDTLTLPSSFNLVREPSFPRRLPSSGSPEQHVQWGFSYTHVAGSPKREAAVKRLGLRQYRWGHIWPALIEKQYFADGRSPQPMDYSERQDWLPADAEGKRKNNGQTLCLSNSAALEWFTDNAANWVLATCKNADYVSMWSADTWRIALCRCEQCQKRGWNATDWYLLVHNEVWRKLKERGWPNVFGWIVYHGSEEVPTKVDLLEHGRQMDCLYAPRPRGGTQHGPFTNDHPVSVKYRKNLEAWLAYLAKQNYQGTRTVFEYYYDLVLLGPLAAGRTHLIPKPDVMQEDMRFYYEKGFDGFFDCNPPSGVWWPDPLSRWLYHRLMWDVNLDLAAARADFFQHYYGPVADTIRAARETVERLMFEEPSEDVVAQLRNLAVQLEETEESVADDEPLTTRIKGFRVWVHYCALCKESEYHEKVTHDKEKGCAAENAIRDWLNGQREFLVKNGFLTNGDLNYMAGPVVNRHLARFK
ncbi:MAG TPA: DUF4838 domain-containing protein [Armatimonadetes bacterium]|nr:DUF4838 domain-containing protein [Armatimonadota bacterium]